MFSILDAPPIRKYQLDAHPKSCSGTYNFLDRLKALHDGVGCRFSFSARLQVAKTSLMCTTELCRSIQHCWIYLRRSKMVLESIVRSWCAFKRQMPKQMHQHKVVLADAILGYTSSALKLFLDPWLILGLPPCGNHQTEVHHKTL